MFLVVSLCIVLVFLFVYCFFIAVQEERDHLLEVGTVIYCDGKKGSIVSLGKKNGELQLVYVDSVEKVDNIVEVLSLEKAFDHENFDNLYVRIHSNSLCKQKNQSFSLEKFVFSWSGNYSVVIEKKIGKNLWLAKMQIDGKLILLHIHPQIEEHICCGMIVNADKLIFSDNDLPIYHKIR